MKKTLLFALVAVFAVSLSSCYRHSVCATYVKAEQKVEKQEADQDL